MHDEELEHLGQRVRHTLLGDEAYHDALRRAMTVALGQGQPVDPDSLAGELSRQTRSKTSPRFRWLW